MILFFFMCLFYYCMIQLYYCHFSVLCLYFVSHLSFICAVFMYKIVDLTLFTLLLYGFFWL